MKSEKVTKTRPRWYDDACGMAHALELVGERWALAVVRELMFGPRRFTELRRDLTGISANVLTQRLEGLEAAGVLVRRRLPPPASVQVYALTDWGLQADEAIMALGRWAARSPAHDATLPLSPVALMLSFRTMFAPGHARGLAVRIGFRFGEDAFAATVADGALAIVRELGTNVDARAIGRPEPLAGIAYGGVPLDAAVAMHAIVVEGDRAALARFLACFALPPRADTG